MSRCFPYPPPGYLRHGLVESIKLEREKVLSKAEQKIHKKREKKEKKKERKEKEKTRSINKKLKKLDDGLNQFRDEQVGNSDLTEEHEPPVCYLSDGTQNSNKRKRETSSSSETTPNGNGIRIRFSFKKPRDDDASLSKERVCSTSGRAECSTQLIAQEQHYPSKLKENTITPCTKKNTITPVTEQKLLHDDGRRDQIPSSGYSVHDNKIQKAALQYKSLIEDLMLLPQQVQNYDDNDEEDWLFTSKQQGEPLAKRSKVDYDVTCRDSAPSCPRACFLPEIEIYALPYTVPF